MALQHPQAPSGHAPLDADRLLTSVQTRLRLINTMSRWASQWAALIAELRRELANVLAELEQARQELAYWRRQAGLSAIAPEDMPPKAYLDAVRAPQHEEYREIVVEVDGKEAVVGLRKDRPVGVDLVREIHDWDAFKATVRELRAGLREDA